MSASSNAAYDETLAYTDTTAASIVSFTTNISGNPAYVNSGDSVVITATFNEQLLASSELRVKLNTLDEITLDTSDVSNTLTGTYNVSSGDNKTALIIDAILSGTTTDLYGNSKSYTETIPTVNIDDSQTLVVDNIPVVAAANISVVGDSNDPAEGDVLGLTFSESVANTATLEGILEASTSVYGVGVVADWSNNDKTLSITLGSGEQYTGQDIVLEDVTDLAGNIGNVTFEIA